MKYLFILNDSPYCSQRTYNALRLVRVLATGNTEVAIFLLGDGVVSGLRRQSPSDFLQCAGNVKNAAWPKRFYRCVSHMFRGTRH